MDKERVRALVHGLRTALGKAEYAAFKADPQSACLPINQNSPWKLSPIRLHPINLYANTPTTLLTMSHKPITFNPSPTSHFPKPSTLYRYPRTLHCTPNPKPCVNSQPKPALYYFYNE